MEEISLGVCVVVQREEEMRTEEKEEQMLRHVVRRCVVFSLIHGNWKLTTVASEIYPSTLPSRLSTPSRDDKDLLTCSVPRFLLLPTVVMLVAPMSPRDTEKLWPTACV